MYDETSVIALLLGAILTVGVIIWGFHVGVFSQIDELADEHSNTPLPKTKEHKAKPPTQYNILAQDEYGEFSLVVDGYQKRTKERLCNILTKLLELRSEFGAKVLDGTGEALIAIYHDGEFVNEYGEVEGTEFVGRVTIWEDMHYDKNSRMIYTETVGYRTEYIVGDEEGGAEEVRSITQFCSEFRKYFALAKKQPEFVTVGAPLPSGNLPPVYPCIPPDLEYKLTYVGNNGAQTERMVKNLRVSRLYLNSSEQFRYFDAQISDTDEWRTFRSDGIIEIVGQGTSFKKLFPKTRA